MDALTTDQLISRLGDHQRIAGDARYDQWQRRESRRAVQTYRAELARRAS